MPHMEIKLLPVTREDVARISGWLQDEDVAESWFGRYSYGNPAHLGYHPEEMEGVSDEEWERIFGDTEHRMMSVYVGDDHIGEVHVAVEEALGDGQLSILIGEKENWHHGYGTAATRAAMSLAFGVWGCTASGSTFLSTTRPPSACSGTSDSSTRERCGRAGPTRAPGSTRL